MNFVLIKNDEQLLEKDNEKCIFFMSLLPIEKLICEKNSYFSEFTFPHYQDLIWNLMTASSNLYPGALSNISGIIFS